MAIKTRSSARPTPQLNDHGMGDVTGWEDATEEFDESKVFMDIVGPSGSGRTSLALSAPGPIAFINTDEKIQGVVQPWVKKGKVIRIHSMSFVATGNVQDTAQRAGVVWDNVGRLMTDSMGWARTTVFDTATEGWEMQRLARFGELSPKGRVDSNYGPVNAEFRSMFKQFRLAGQTNVISIHQCKDEYIDKMVNGKLTSQRTGRQLRAGFKEFQYMADVVIRTDRTIDGKFTATIEKGWFNAHSEGTTFEGDHDPENPLSISFANIMSFITDTEVERWMT